MQNRQTSQTPRLAALILEKHLGRNEQDTLNILWLSKAWKTENSHQQCVESTKCRDGQGEQQVPEQGQASA